MKTLLFLRGNWLRLASPFIAIAMLALVTNASAVNYFPRAWMDQSSGYAIGGFDPVEYFVHARAVRPNTAIEAFWGGANWKFRNTGNREAFLSHPEIYAPRFGGADPHMLAKRRQVLGNPTLFDVYDGRLYLFYNGLSLSRWKQHRAAFLIHAKQAWPRAAIKLGLDAGPPEVAPVPVPAPPPPPPPAPFPYPVPGL